MRLVYFPIILISVSLDCLLVETKQDDAACEEESLKRNLADVIFGGSRMATYLLTDTVDSRLNLSNPIDANVSHLLGNGKSDLDGVSVDVIERAWHLMHEHAEAVISQWLNEVRPIIHESLLIANVSQQCHEAAAKTLTAASRLDRWAIQSKYLLRIPRISL